MARLRPAARACVGLCVAALVLTACTAFRSVLPPQQGSAIATSATLAPSPSIEGGCPWPASRWGPGVYEVRGAASGGSLWGLVFGRQPLPREVQVKIVWSMTGTGVPSLTALSPGGSSIGPDRGPSPQSGNWHRPGAEYGSAFVFDEPGCWRIHAERGATVGDIWLRVA